MPKLKVKRFEQDPNCCAIAACACVANYWDENKDYEIAKKITNRKVKRNFKKNNDGLYSGEICLLLNAMGFNKVTIVSSDMDIFDYQWKNFKRKKMITILEESLKHKKYVEEKKQTRSLLKWLKNMEYDNNLIIDYNFGRYIRHFIRQKRPIILSYNWTMYFKYCKTNEKGYEDVHNGGSEMHAVVAYGYDTKGVHICDSHNLLYRYRRKKYRNGFYKMSWENLMTVMGEGDIYIADKYSI